MKPLAAAAAILVLAAWVPATARADDDDNAAPVTQVTVTSQRLDVARAEIQPSLGASTYTITNDTVESRPGGETMSLDRVLLQMPGVTEDGFGRLHVRGNQGGLEYRVNNVIIPEGLTDLGDMLSTRTAASVELVTGTLPAQYGLNVAGVVNITTKSGAYLDGGEAELLLAAAKRSEAKARLGIPAGCPVVGAAGPRASPLRRADRAQASGLKALPAAPYPIGRHAKLWPRAFDLRKRLRLPAADTAE